MTAQYIEQELCAFKTLSLQFLREQIVTEEAPMLL